MRLSLEYLGIHWLWRRCLRGCGLLWLASHGTGEVQCTSPRFHHSLGFFKHILLFVPGNGFPKIGFFAT
jgi:hypothetical protein